MEEREGRVREGGEGRESSCNYYSCSCGKIKEAKQKLSKSKLIKIIII